jgi:endonuclease/exonuclease/phosphatase (EEP) superfamily protein YafD
LRITTRYAGYGIFFFFLILMAACGYAPVEKAFTISGDTYRKKVMDPSSIRVLNWNIHKEGNQAEWRKEFRRIVAEKNPHIITFQEARLENGFKAFFDEDLRIGWAFSPNTFQEKYEAYCGVMTAAHSKPDAVMALLSEGFEPITRTPKAALFTRYDLGPDHPSLLVVNVHGINFKIGLDDFRDQLVEIFDRIADHRGPVVLAGDFNTWRDRRLDFLAESAEAAGLAAVDFSPETHRIESRSDNPLDHIFYSRDLLSPKIGSPDVLEEVTTSDHRPLYVELTWKRRDDPALRLN